MTRRDRAAADAATIRSWGVSLGAAVVLLAGCSDSTGPATDSPRYKKEIAAVCERFHRQRASEHLDVALPDNGPALLQLMTRTERLLREQYRALIAVGIPSSDRIGRRWLADQRRLIDLFDAERRAIAAAIPRERQRARELARLDHMHYAEVSALGRRFRPLEQLALAMRARHKQVVAQLPAKMRALRERQAHFAMLNATDSPVAVAGFYTGRRIAPLVTQMERLAPHEDAGLCPPSAR
jgi:hypothetical protein